MLAEPDPDTTLSSNGIDLLIDDVTAINREQHLVSTSGGEEVKYAKLVSLPGRSPWFRRSCGQRRRLAIQKAAPYLERMLEAMDSAKDVLIVGCGFIGVELAEECVKRRKVNVRIVEMLRHCL